MSCNPFLKDESIKSPFESNDYIQTINRFQYLKEIHGIGLITGEPGFGKTYSVRSFIKLLNKDLYKIIYLSGSKEWTVFDFFKIIANNLNLDTGSCYRTDIYNNIQKEIKRLVLHDRVQPIVIIDEAQFLSKDILQNFKVLYDFEMDSKDYVTLILVGTPELKAELSKNVYEPLKQRIIVNYTFNGLSREEVKSYIITRLEISNTNTEIFNSEAINSLYSCCKSSPRRLNTLIINSLMLGFQNKITTLDSEIIMNAKNEMDLN
jgi:type II secretory pathway predicted ATPase ExeA